jgi:hypothetical protein
LPAGGVAPDADMPPAGVVGVVAPAGIAEGGAAVVGADAAAGRPADAAGVEVGAVG